jgi:hypothetical protein
MFYRVLGMLVWNGGKVLLRQKYGRTYVPKPVLAGAVVAVAGGVALLIARSHSSDS